MSKQHDPDDFQRMSHHEMQRERFGVPMSACPRCEGGRGDLCDTCEQELQAEPPTDDTEEGER